MPRKFHNFLPEKDYAGWLALGLVFLIISQFLSNKPGLPTQALRWIFLAAAVVNYSIILYLYERDFQAKKKKRSSAEEKTEPDNK